MKRFLFRALAFLTGVSLSLGLVQASFSDIQESEYKESIEFLQEQGVLQGYSDGTFKPEATINRAELLKIVFAAIDEDAGETTGGCFPDVTDQWFAPYVCKAKELGVVQGYPDGLYHPEQEVNLVEAFKIAIEGFGLPVEDAQEGEQWYVPYTEFIHDNNIFSKYAYYPDASAKRGEVAYEVHQLLRIFSGVQEVSTERYSGSSGCGTTPPSTAPSTFTVDGVQREAIVVIPDNYDPNEPIPILFAFHGRTSPNTQVRQYYRFERVADNEAIFVYPAGLKNGSSFTWSNTGDSADDLRDYEFFDVMYDELTSKYCVNLDEVYAAGHSLGAWFVNSLACARGDVLRGVTTLGGARSTGTCTGPVAVMQWHNPDDNLAPYYTGEAARDDYLEQNHCSAESEATEPAWANCVEYKNCLEDAPTLFCPHNVDYDEYSGEYYPHTWPKNAGEEMWNFLESL